MNDKVMDDKHYYFKAFGQLHEICLELGSIHQREAHVLVNTSNVNFKLGTGIAGNLRDNFGLKDHNGVKAAEGEVWLEGTNTHKMILHAMTSVSEDAKVKDQVHARVMGQIAQLSVGSIAIPGFSTGAFLGQRSLNESVEAFVNLVFKYMLTGKELKQLLLSTRRKFSMLC